MRSQGVITFKSLPYEVVDIRMIFSLPEKMKIKYFSSVLYSVSANVSHWRCSSEFVMTLPFPQLNTISPQKFGGQAVSQMGCLDSLSSQDSKQSYL